MHPFATIKRNGSQRVEPPTPTVELPPFAKQILRKQHNQSDKNILIYLTKESYTDSHIVAFQPPSKSQELRGCVAFGRNRSEQSRNALGSRKPSYRLKDRQLSHSISMGGA